MNATKFQSNVGERVSFFVIAGRTADELYAGYARLTGADAAAAQGRVRPDPEQGAL
jgi:alpha-glucosidase (family GH31 glycosyl hydrolase)